MRTPTLAAALCGATTVTLAAFAASAFAEGPIGFQTGQPGMLDAVAPGATVERVITVGDTLSNGYRFESIPDGIAIYGGDRGRVDVFVNHETSTVPFPFTYPGTATEASQNDFDNAQVSRLTLNDETAGVLDGKMVITSAEGFQRFCSNFLATAKEGFDRPILFTNEEGIDWVNRTGQSWPPPVSPAPDFEATPAARQAGVVVAYDVKNGQRRPIWGMGRHNHENSVAIPGFRDVVVLSGDDSFVSNPAQSQVYAYIAGNRRDVWEDRGDLWAFVSDDPNVDDYYDFGVGDLAKSVSGRFVKVPKDVATGRKPNGDDLVAADKGFPAPPADDPATWQRSIFPPRHGVDGPQWVLDQWGNAANNTYGANVFDFVRIEDIAVDKRRGMSNVIYLADSGRGATSAGGNAFTSSNGRIWKMVLDKRDPTKVTSLSILVEGDDFPVKTLDEIHQPDNLDTTAAGSLLITEDPGSSQQFVQADWGLPNATTGRLWRVDLKAQIPDAAKAPVAKVDQTADEGPTDVDGVAGVYAPGNLGAWESSGVIDASSVFGAGAFLVTVQAHSLWVQKETVTNFSTLALSFTNKREGGQLVLLRVPGA
jgi:uncharacterized protein DUF839